MVLTQPDSNTDMDMGTDMVTDMDTDMVMDMDIMMKILKRNRYHAGRSLKIISSQVKLQ